MSYATPRLRIALIAEQQSVYLKLGYSKEACAALTHDGEVQAVALTLKSLGHDVTLIPGIQSLVEMLAAGKHKEWDLAFNMAQGFHGTARESHVPALLEAYLIPHTFSDAATMALCQNKANTKVRYHDSNCRFANAHILTGDTVSYKSVLDHHGIPNAPFMVIPTEYASLPSKTPLLSHYPLFVKPVAEGSSKGIGNFNKLDSPAELELAVQTLKAKFPGQDIIVEAFLSGREFSVSILETGSCNRVIGVREHIWHTISPTWGTREHSTDGNATNRGGEKVDGIDEEDNYLTEQNFAGWESKTSNECLLHYSDSLDMDDPKVKRACQVALDAWSVIGCRDAGRVDIRFDSNEPDAVPNVLEVNPIAGLLPRHSPLPACAEENGISYETLLTSIIEIALRRKSQIKSAEVRNGTMY